MPTFKYRARNSEGVVQAGLIEAEGQEHAQQALEDRGMELVSIEPYTKVEAASKGFLYFINRVGARDLVVVTRSLSVMVSAAVPLPEAMRNIARQTKNPKLQSVITDIATEIEGGARLSDAFEHHPEVFSGFFINMVRSGETSGQLSEVLEYLAEQQEKDFDLMSKLKGAMIYPAFIVSTMFIVGFVMMVFVVPKLTEVLTEANVALPLTTRILISTSGFLQSFWYIVIIGVVGIAVGSRYYIRTTQGRYQWDWFKVHMPIFGTMFQEIYVVRFARSLGTLLKGGVDLVEGLEIVANVIGNELWRRAVYETIREVNDGNSIITAFQRHKFVPTMMNQMLSVGEGTGRTQDILGRVSAFYQREVDNMIDNLTKLIEPLVLVLLGLGVGVMVSAILLPMYQLSSAM